MDWRLLNGWWERLRYSRREAIRRGQDAEFERVRRERDAEKRKPDEDDRVERLFTGVLVSEQYRRQFRQILDDIADASRAAAQAYQRAVRDAEAAEAALSEVKRHALVLPDGRRVYFDAAGRLLMEDGGEIMEAAELEFARRARDLNPGATSYDAYLKKREAMAEADAHVDQVSGILQRLRDLKERLASGNATPDDLAAAHKELDETVRSMSPDMREDYEQLRAARTSQVFAEDSATATRTTLYTEFSRASQAFSAQNSQPSADLGEADRPAYKNAPEF